MFHLTTHSIHFYLQLYGVGHIVKDHSDNEKGNSFRLATWDLLYTPSHRQVEHWLGCVFDAFLVILTFILTNFVFIWYSYTLVYS